MFTRIENTHLFIIVIMLCFLSACGQRPKGTPEKIAVNAVKASRQTLKDFLVYLGDIKAEDEAEIFPKVSGKILERLAQEGDRVEKGDVLAYIDRDEVGFEFEKSPVESPLDGLVGRVYVDVGATVSPQTPIGLVVKMSAVKVRIDAAERDLPKIRRGQPAQVKVDAYPGRIFKGRVESVSPVVDRTSRTALVEIKIPNKDLSIKPGMFARIKILVNEKQDVLTVPRDAIVMQDSARYIFVVGDGDVVHRRKIEIGLHENNRFEIMSGITEGELVVMMGNTLLKEGDIVEVVSDIDIQEQQE